MIRLPGLIDVHVHLRTPGQEQKEDFYTGTSAALAGGFTTLIDMPNNLTPITTTQRLEEKIEVAKKDIVCDISFHFGSLGENFEEFPKVYEKVAGLKIYLNQTTGNFIVDEKVFEEICRKWPLGKPILVHAEENILEAILRIAHKYNQKIHVCHVSSKRELEIIISAKRRGDSVTCGVTPHHLFLTQENEKSLGPFGKMKPILKSKTDVEFLWQHLSDVDIIESDHAPHSKKEKESDPPPFGVPGLETTLSLLLTAYSEKRITLSDINRLCFDNPRKIFHIPTDENTYSEIDENEEWIIDNKNLLTKCGWSPFAGWKVKGKVKRVYLRGTKVFEDGRVLVKPGFGEVITQFTNGII